MSLISLTLLAALLASVLSATVGTYIVVRRRVIASGGIAHASLGGVGLGALCGFSPLTGATFFAVASALLLQRLQRKHGVREDSAVSLLWTSGMALGILLSFLTPGFTADLLGYLFGNILAVSGEMLGWMALFTVCVLIFFVAMWRTVLAVSLDADFARTQGLPVDAVEGVLSVITALVIVCLTKMVGIVLVVALLSVPQLTASLFTHTFRTMMWVSGLVALAACGLGLLLSFVVDVPAGAAIVLCAAAIYALARAIKYIVVSYILR